MLQVVDRPSRKSIVQDILRIPGFLRFILTLPRERLLWSSFPTPRSQCGFWEREVLGKWVAVNLKKTRLSGSAARGREYLDMKYIETFCVSKVVFSWLLQPCRARLEFETTNMRCSVSPEKRLAILLHWLGHGFAERQLATLYRVVYRAVCHCEWHTAQWCGSCDGMPGANFDSISCWSSPP